MAEVIGLIVSSFPAIKLARLHCRHLEVQAPKKKKFEWFRCGMLVVPWDETKMSLNGFQLLGVICTMSHQLRSIRQSWCLTTDASHTSWGVSFENQSTNGEWSMEERKKTHRLARTENSPVGASEFYLLGMRRECNQRVLRRICTIAWPLKVHLFSRGQPTCMHGDLVYLRVHLQTPFHRATYTSRARLQ